MPKSRLVPSLSRRKLLATSIPALGGAAALLKGGGPAAAETSPTPHAGHDMSGMGDAGAGTLGPGHAAFQDGRTVDHVANGFDPHEILRDFDSGKTRRLPNGRVLREWELVAGDKEIEVAPGVKFEAWTYNGRIPGPTLRCPRGRAVADHVHQRVRAPAHDPLPRHPPAEMDGVPGVGAGVIAPGGRTVYEFDAEPVRPAPVPLPRRPLAEHIAKGLYGAFIIDPKEGRPEADELVMVMNGFDTNFDRSNEIYAVNTIGVRLHGPADRGEAGRAGADLPRERARVRPDQLLPHPRQLLPLLPDRHRRSSRSSSPTP